MFSGHRQQHSGQKGNLPHQIKQGLLAKQAHIQSHLVIAAPTSVNSLPQVPQGCSHPPLHRHVNILIGQPNLELAHAVFPQQVYQEAHHTIPLGPLDGSYVLPRLLPRDLCRRYEDWNFRFGTMLLIGLLAASYFLPGFSAFRWISQASRQMITVLL